MARKAKQRLSDKAAETEKAHASPPTIFDDGRRRPSSTPIPWRMWPRGKHMDAEMFWHQSWYGARALAAAHFGVHRESIMWDENYGKTE